METRLLSDLSYEEFEAEKPIIPLYNEAKRIERLLLINHAAPGKDYTYLDLFKLAIENLKIKQMEQIAKQIVEQIEEGSRQIADGLGGIGYQLEFQNELETRKEK